MRRCVFIDRDGVINEPPAPGEYIVRWEDFRIIPAVVDWIRLVRALGYLVVVVTNQRCVALGLVSQAGVDEIHRRMAEELAACGAPIDDVYCCPHGEDACDCRKPKPGMVTAAAEKWDIDLRQSIMIGDSDRDRGLAANTGMTFVEVRDGTVIAVVEKCQD
jgi:D-glycero-D-manno-heptose 1,7-bisphosphate phosphatase